MSILDVLRRRTQERHVSADDFVREAIQAEASGQTKGLDVGRLEQSLAAIGWDADDFERAVERQREIDGLRSIVSQKDAAHKRFRRAADAATKTRTENEAAIKRLQAEIEAAELVKSKADFELKTIRENEQQLRQFESDQHRRERMQLKQLRSDLLTRQRELEQQAQAERNTLANVGGVRSPHDGSVRPVEAPSVREFRNEQHRQQFIDAKEQTIAKINGELAEIEAELGTTTEALDQAEREAVTGAA